MLIPHRGRAGQGGRGLIKGRFYPAKWKVVELCFGRLSKGAGCFSGVAMVWWEPMRCGCGIGASFDGTGAGMWKKTMGYCITGKWRVLWLATRCPHPQPHLFSLIQMQSCGTTYCYLTGSKRNIHFIFRKIHQPLAHLAAHFTFSCSCYHMAIILIIHLKSYVKSIYF